MSRSDLLNKVLAFRHQRLHEAKKPPKQISLSAVRAKIDKPSKYLFRKRDALLEKMAVRRAYKPRESIYD